MAANNYAYDYGDNLQYNAAPLKQPSPAPKSRPQPERKLKRLDNPLHDSAARQRAANLAVIKFSAVVLVAFIALTAICASFSAVRKQQINLAKQKHTLSIFQSQQVEITAKLNALVTPDKIAKIAVEKLGMVKLADENRSYISFEDKNEVIVSKEK